MAPLELRTLSPRTAYLPSPSTVGLLETAAGPVLADSGNDEDGGRRILKALTAQEKKPAAVVLTHSNADHMGGAAFIASRTGAPVYASRMEAAFCADPILEPSFLWGGYPPAELRGKFFVAPSCAASVVEAGPLGGVLGGIEAVPLPGHYFGQMGFLFDGVLFAGDALFGAASLAKHPLFFVYDPAAFLESLDRIDALGPDLVVPSHGDPTADVAALTGTNRAAAERIAAAVLEACASAVTAEEALAALFDRFGIAPDWAQYALVGSTVRSYLCYLRGRGAVEAEFSAGRLLWRRR